MPAHHSVSLILLVPRFMVGPPQCYRVDVEAAGPELAAWAAQGHGRAELAVEGEVNWRHEAVAARRAERQGATLIAAGQQDGGRAKGGGVHRLLLLVHDGQGRLASADRQLDLVAANLLLVPAVGMPVAAALGACARGPDQKRRQAACEQQPAVQAD